MTATWIWAASFYGAATSGYKYGLSGPMHYGFWGALMIFFIYPFGLRFRALAPNAHTLAEIMHARHGSASQLILAISNLLGSVISLMVNFTAAGALVAVLITAVVSDRCVNRRCRSVVVYAVFGISSFYLNRFCPSGCHDAGGGDFDSVDTL